MHSLDPVGRKSVKNIVTRIYPFGVVPTDRAITIVDTAEQIYTNTRRRTVWLDPNRNVLQTRTQISRWDAFKLATNVT